MKTSISFSCQRRMLLPILIGTCFTFAQSLQGQSQDAFYTIPQDWPKEWKAEAQQMDLKAIQTGFFLNYALLTDQQVSEFRQPFHTKKGDYQRSVRAIDWFRLYQQLRASDLRRQPLPVDKKSLYIANQNKGAAGVDVPIGILQLSGNLLTKQQIEENKAAKKQLKAVDGSKYETLPILAASVLQEEVYQGLVNLQFAPAYYFSNVNQPIQEVSVDFLDGSGPHAVHLGAPQSISHRYDSPGKKVISIQVKTKEKEYTFLSQLDIKTVDPYPTGLIYNLEAPLAIQATDKKSARLASTITGGTLRAILGCDGVLDKPILIIEGFDPGNKNGLDYYINKYLGPLVNGVYYGTFDRMLYSGYDLVFLNFNEARDYLQNSANIVKAAIKKLNDVKSGNGQLIVIGESAGGVVARIALKQLEQESYSPNVSHYISFDSPHRGANVPVGVQFLARDAGSRALLQVANLFISAVQDLFSIIDDGDQPAARQLILRRADFNGGVYVHPDFTNLQSYLSSLGYPTQSRNIALVSGSLSGAGQQNKYANAENQGDNIIALGNFYYDATARVAVSNQSTQVSYLHIGGLDYSWFNCTLPTCPDVVPGGYDRSVEREVDSNTGFRYCFIPTYSAIDSPSAINSDFDMYQITQNSSTPFAHIYGNTLNSEHVNVAQKEVVWDNVFASEFGITNPSCQQALSYYPPSPLVNAPSSLCNGAGGYIIADDASGGLVQLEYTWKLIDLSNGYVTVKTGTGPYFSVVASDYSPGYYMLVLTDNYPGHADVYGSNSAIIAMNINCSPGARVSVSEMDDLVTVYPNPSTGSVFVSLPTMGTEPYQITLSTGKGELIHQKTLTDQRSYPLDLKNHPPGIYLLHVSNGNQHWTKKLLINR